MNEKWKLNKQKLYNALKEKGISIGEFRLDRGDEIFQEDTLGYLNLQKIAGKVKVEVRTNEGWELPHMHLSNGKFLCAIRLDKPEYFIHNKYRDKLNNTQAKLFDEFMRSEEKGETLWEYAKRVFNEKFSDHKIDIKEQPDYTKLNRKD